MSMGRWSDGGVQGELFLTSGDFPRSPGHVFYDRLNRLLAEAKFDPFVESLCSPYYEDRSQPGRPSVPPSVYFRMMFVGYFEGIDSQRGIAWRCADSFSLRTYLGLSWNDSSPDHSSLSRTRKRLPESVHQSVFDWVLKLCADRHLLTDPSVVGVDSTMIEANAAMRSIVRKDTKQGYLDYVKSLMREADGITKNGSPAKSSTDKNEPPINPPSGDASATTPSAPVASSTQESTAKTECSTMSESTPKPEPTLAEIIRFDRNRKGKTCSNADWEARHDKDARIAKMKDGRTRLAYKVEHVVDLKSEVILSAEIYAADQSDHQTGIDSVMSARCHLTSAGLEMTIDACAEDKGYHSREQLALAELYSLRTYVAEPDRPHRLRWVDRPKEEQLAVHSNRRRIKGERGKALQRRRSEVTERSFAHLCETGGSRRSWLRGFGNIRKRYPLAAAARNLGLLMRKKFGMGKPRTLQSNGSSNGGDGGGNSDGESGPDKPGGPKSIMKRIWDQLLAIPNQISHVRDSLRVFELRHDNTYAFAW